MGNTITPVADMVADARAAIREIDATDVAALVEDEGTVLVDLRDIRERQRSGFIPGSIHAPRGMIEFWVDPQSPYHKDVFAQEDKRYVFYCASGWRSALTVKTLQDMGFEAAHVAGGFGAWVEGGGEVATLPPRDA